MSISLTHQNGTLDLSIAAGDLATDDGLETAVVISLFTDRRAASTDPLPTGETDRRGCWMDATLDDLGTGQADAGIGSLLWLLNREKTLTSVLDRARQYAEQALAWLVSDKIAESVSVTAERLGQAGKDWLALSIQISRPARPAIAFRYDYNWQQQMYLAA